MRYLKGARVRTWSLFVSCLACACTFASPYCQNILRYVARRVAPTDYETDVHAKVSRWAATYGSGCVSDTREVVSLLQASTRERGNPNAAAMERHNTQDGWMRNRWKGRRANVSQEKVGFVDRRVADWTLFAPRVVLRTGSRARDLSPPYHGQPSERNDLAGHLAASESMGLHLLCGG